jgi:hypothetical protein
MCHCRRTKDIVAVEREVIMNHLERHKWFKGIQTEHEAVVDFIWSYAWLMRETFCAKLCEEGGECDASVAFRSGFLSDISDGELLKVINEYNGNKDRELNVIQLTVIKHHISMHKWFHQIANYKDAVKSFLHMFGPIIEDMYHVNKKSRAAMRRVHSKIDTHHSKVETKRR